MSLRPLLKDRGLALHPPRNWAVGIRDYTTNRAVSHVARTERDEMKIKDRHGTVVFEVLPPLNPEDHPQGMSKLEFVHLSDDDPKVSLTFDLPSPSNSMSSSGTDGAWSRTQLSFA